MQCATGSYAGLAGATSLPREEQLDTQLTFSVANPFLTPSPNHLPPDSMGLHKVGNPNKDLAVTLHLYCPPYGSCRMWLDAGDAAVVQRPTITFHSMFGDLVA